MNIENTSQYNKIQINSKLPQTTASKMNTNQQKLSSITSRMVGFRSYMEETYHCLAVMLVKVVTGSGIHGSNLFISSLVIWLAYPSLPATQQLAVG